MFRIFPLAAALAAACSIVPTVMAQDLQTTTTDNQAEIVQQLPTVVVVASRHLNRCSVPLAM